MILVIAPYLSVYKHYLEDHKLSPTEYRYILSEDRLHGYKPGTRVERIGYWNDDKRCLQLLEKARQLGYEIYDVRG